MRVLFSQRISHRSFRKETPEEQARYLRSRFDFVDAVKAANNVRKRATNAETKIFWGKTISCLRSCLHHG
jgi:hypothetical protein